MSRSPAGCGRPAWSYSWTTGIGAPSAGRRAPGVRARRSRRRGGAGAAAHRTRRARTRCSRRAPDRGARTRPRPGATTRAAARRRTPGGGPQLVGGRDQVAEAGRGVRRRAVGQPLVDVGLQPPVRSSASSGVRSDSRSRTCATNVATSGRTVWLIARSPSRRPGRRVPRSGATRPPDLRGGRSMARARYVTGEEPGHEGRCAQLRARAWGGSPRPGRRPVTRRATRPSRRGCRARS